MTCCIYHESHIKEIIDFLTAHGIRKTYSNVYDGLIVELPDNSFEYLIEDLPEPTASSIKEAQQSRKPIFVLYRRMITKDYNLYKINTNKLASGTIAAIRGSSIKSDKNFFEMFNKEKEFNDPASSDIVDRRAIILLSK